MESPLFLTHKLSVAELKSLLNVYDFQLRDHFLSTDNVYQSLCRCTHTHRKQPCELVNTPYCVKCAVANKKLISFKSLLFHPDFVRKRLAECCGHWHFPPCGVCLGCRTKRDCIVQAPFECQLTTESTCTSFGTAPMHITSDLSCSASVREHAYNTRSPMFYFCTDHVHTHAHMNPAYNERPCLVQTLECCAKATRVDEFDKSFVVTATSAKATGKGRRPVNSRSFNCKLSQRRNQSKEEFVGNQTEYVEKNFVIFDPSLWREQSTNHFVSLIRALVNVPDSVTERYRRFEASNFQVSNIKKYKSGKQSVVRTSITGFETKGVYQTATISCTLPSRSVIIPQQLYDTLANDYDMTLVAVKRDPSIKQTCMFICRALRNTDKSVHTLVIPDAIARPLNQDQDGDKNGVYLLPIYARGGYDRRESFLHRLAKLELAVAYRADKTLIATPRYSFSEYNLQVIYRKREELLSNDFFRRTCRKGVEHMIGAGCGYLRREYETFCGLLIDINRRKEDLTINLDDLLLQKDTLPGVIESGAKGHAETLDMFFDNLKSKRLLFEQKSHMIEQMDRYISSSKELRHTGRNQFVSLYAAHDLTVLMGCVYLNKEFFADFKPFACSGTLMFTEGSLDEFIEDLKLLGDYDDCCDKI